jgi:hypothetical protein
MVVTSHSSLNYGPKWPYLNLPDAASVHELDRIRDSMKARMIEPMVKSISADERA